MLSATQRANCGRRSADAPSWELNAVRAAAGQRSLGRAGRRARRDEAGSSRREGEMVNKVKELLRKSVYYEADLSATIFRMATEGSPADKVMAERYADSPDVDPHRLWRLIVMAFDDLYRCVRAVEPDERVDSPPRACRD